MMLNSKMMVLVSLVLSVHSASEMMGFPELDKYGPPKGFRKGDIAKFDDTSKTMPFCAQFVPKGAVLEITKDENEHGMVQVTDGKRLYSVNQKDLERLAPDERFSIADTVIIKGVEHGDIVHGVIGVGQKGTVTGFHKGDWFVKLKGSGKTMLYRPQLLEKVASFSFSDISKKYSTNFER